VIARRGRLAWGIASTLLFCLLLPAHDARAQNPHQALGPDDVSDVPPGNATIVGLLSHPDGPESTEGSTVILYSLAADGRPGLRNVRADARGHFRFENLSNASGITYLIGASYRGVPYGKRVVFPAGQSEIALVIDVEDPSLDTSTIRVGASSLRVEWIGAQLGVEEIHQLENPGQAVVYVPPEQRAGKAAAFRVTLPDNVSGLDTSLSGVTEGYQVRGRELLFWGPIYVGGLELRFRYLLPIARPHTGDLSLRWQLDSGSSDVTLLHPPGGPHLEVTGVAPGPNVDLADFSLRSLALGRVPPGGTIDARVSLPEMSSDSAGIEISRSDVWIDADDTFMQVNIETQMQIAPGAHLTGSPSDPLLSFQLPDAAELLGASPDAQRLGLVPLGDGDLGVIGPLSPGNQSFAFRYRVPVEAGRPRLDLELPGAVGTLNVLIADTGVVIDTDRLHRRRPFRQGTRVYLHREAFSIDPDEVISIGLELIDRGAVSPNTQLFATSAFAAVGVWFIVSPLTRRQRNRGAVYERARIRSERDIVYQSIRDLEHDFETGKIEQTQYQVMHQELRTRGLELLQRERDAGRATAMPGAVSAPASNPAPAARCSACGVELQADWRFCAGCGAPRNRQPGTAEADA